MANGGGGYTYTLIFQNDSSTTASACVYQEDLGIGVAGAMPLAWLVQGARPTTQLKFTWSVGYDFVWSQTGELAPGVVVSSSQVWPADLSSSNQVTFTDAGQVFGFTTQVAGPVSGTLTVVEDATIPVGEAAVGIGMYGAGTFVVGAQPNVGVNFTPGIPQYWIAFGSYSEGQVLEPSQISNPTQVVFPANVYSMTATLSASNTWSVNPTESVNAAYLAARRQNPRARWGA